MHHPAFAKRIRASHRMNRFRSLVFCIRPVLVVRHDKNRTPPHNAILRAPLPRRNKLTRAHLALTC